MNEFLHNLVADDSLPRFDGAPDQRCGSRRLCWSPRSNEWTKTFVSRKNLPFIHLFASEMSSRSDVLEPLHQGIEFARAPRLSRELLQPLPKCFIQSPALRLGDLPGLLDKPLVRAQSDIFHTNMVYTITVQ
jgi:hypothetical protein